MKKDIVKQIEVHNLLGKMLEENRELYEQIMDSNIASYFNKICNLAMSEQSAALANCKHELQKLKND